MQFIDSLTWRYGVAIFILYMQMQLAVPTPVLKVQLHEMKISLHNDTNYVTEIMRLAKTAEMHNYMHVEADACDNFFEYACGNWAKINPAENAHPRETNFFELLTQAYNQKQLIVLKAHKKPGDNEADVKVKEFFQSCQHLSDVRRGKFRLKLRQIMSEFGQMPALLPDGMWYERDTFDWIETVANIQKKYGIDIIIHLGVRPDFEDKTVNKLFIGQPMFKLQSRSMYTSNATKWHRDNYQQEMQKNLQIFLGVEEKRAQRTAEEMLNFEVQLAEGIMERQMAVTFKSLSKLRTLDEMQEAYAPYVDYKTFVHIVLGEDYNETVYEYFVSYQAHLKNVIKRTPKTQLANYIMYQLMQEFFFDLDETRAEMEKICLDRTKGFFARVLDNIIYRTYNNEDTEDDINMIWTKLKETFKAELSSEKLNWLTLTTRQLALEKLDAMKLEINSYEHANFSDEYAALNISNSDFLENTRQILMFETQRVIASIYEKPKPLEAPVLLSYSPAYIGTENLIKIPVSLLQPNFLWSDYYPHALKFGTLGFLVAHELIHGFDDMGRNYDLLGNDKLWWDSQSMAAFDERKQCFKNQYARFLYGGKYLPESDLQAENIADNGAVQVAYAAYMNWLTSINEAAVVEGEVKVAAAKRRKEIQQMEQLPNMNYTNKQLFFISFAQFWCNDVNELFKDKISLVSVHAPAMYRVIGPLANFNEFSKEFKCAAGTTMNPQQKCQIY